MAIFFFLLCCCCSVYIVLTSICRLFRPVCGKPQIIKWKSLLVWFFLCIIFNGIINVDGMEPTLPLVESHFVYFINLWMMVLFVKVHYSHFDFTWAGNFVAGRSTCDTPTVPTWCRLVARGGQIAEELSLFLLFFSRFQHSIGCVLCVHAISIISTPMPIKTHTPQSDGQIKLARLNHIYYSCSNWRKTQIPRLSFYSIWYFMCTNLLPEHRWNDMNIALKWFITRFV